jgi:hypothetical protein
MEYKLEIYSANGKLIDTKVITEEQFLILHSCSKNSTVNNSIVNSRKIVYKRKSIIIKLYLKHSINTDLFAK